MEMRCSAINKDLECFKIACTFASCILMYIERLPGSRKRVSGPLGHVRDRECRQRTGHQLLRRHAMHPISSHRSQDRLSFPHPLDVRQPIKQPAPATAAQDYVAGYCGRSCLSSRYCRVSVRPSLCAILVGTQMISMMHIWASISYHWCFNIAVTPR